MDLSRYFQMEEERLKKQKNMNKKKMKDRYTNCSVKEKNVLESIRKAILESNFHLEDYQYEGAPQSLYFYKGLQNSNAFLSIGYNKSYPDEILTSGFNTKISIIEVENILNNLTEKHLNPLFDITKRFSSTISFNKYTVNNFDEVWDSFKKYDDIDLATNPEVLDALCAHYIEVIGKHFIPFWEKYSDLQYINDEIIDKISEDELNNYLPGQGNFKKLIIMRICKNEKYENYKSYLDELVVKAVQEDAERYLPYQNLFNELIQILENK